MMYKVRHFDLQEYVCPHVFAKYGETAWQFLDPRLTITMDTLRDILDRPIFGNTWHQGGKFSQRGLRCIQCELVLKAIDNNELIFSEHMEGQSFDFDVQGMTASEVRLWIVKHSILLPYPVRLESNVSWVHLGVRDNGKQKVYLFKAA